MADNHLGNYCKPPQAWESNISAVYLVAMVSTLYYAHIHTHHLYSCLDIYNIDKLVLDKAFHNLLKKNVNLSYYYSNIKYFRKANSRYGIIFRMEVHMQSMLELGDLIFPDYILLFYKF